VIVILLATILFVVALPAGMLTPAAAQSQPGVSWIVRTSGTNNYLLDVTWSGSQFVAVGDHGTILTSSSGAPPPLPLVAAAVDIIVSAS
jgi:hypothetical protein